MLDTGSYEERNNNVPVQCRGWLTPLGDLTHIFTITIRDYRVQYDNKYLRPDTLAQRREGKRVELALDEGADISLPLAGVQRRCIALRTHLALNKALNAVRGRDDARLRIEGTGR
jgi:hypothetical protein